MTRWRDIPPRLYQGLVFLDGLIDHVWRLKQRKLFK